METGSGLDGHVLPDGVINNGLGEVYHRLLNNPFGVRVALITGYLLDQSVYAAAV